MGGVVVIMQEQPTLSISARMRAREIAKYLTFVRFITDYILALDWDWGKANDPSPTAGEGSSLTKLWRVVFKPKALRAG